MGYNTIPDTMMSLDRVKRFGELMDYYGYFSWHTLCELGGSLMFLLPWIVLFLMSLSLLTKQGRLSYKAYRGSYDGYGAAVVSIWILTWVAGIFAHGAIFTGFFGYHIHSWLSLGSIHSAEQFFFKYFTLMGFTAW